VTCRCSASKAAAKAPWPKRGRGCSLAHSRSGLLKYTGMGLDPAPPTMHTSSGVTHCKYHQLLGVLYTLLCST
jgi:hypothetical protein